VKSLVVSTQIVAVRLLYSKPCAGRPEASAPGSRLGFQNEQDPAALLLLAQRQQKESSDGGGRS
jgi:hypothetical protein